MANPNICLPVLRRLTVKDFGLFPGADGSGIDHVFEPGVSVIVGINGLGKTTLLNIIYRLLVGPYDPMKDDHGIQLTQTRLKKRDSFDYFSRRDLREADQATAQGEFSFRGKTLVVTRKLNDLSIVSASIDGVALAVSDPVGENKEDARETDIWQLSGCASHYDFNLIIRSVVFFLEQKIPVVWDQVAQAEIFRILLLQSEDATSIAKLASEIQQLDSQRRNAFAQLTRYERQLAKRIVDMPEGTDLQREYDRVSEQVRLLDSQLGRRRVTVDELELARDRSRQKLDAVKLDLEEATRGVEQSCHVFFRAQYPKLPAVAEHVLQGIISNSGCHVCGSRENDLAEQFHHLAEVGACPICRSPREKQAESSSDSVIELDVVQSEVARVKTLKADIETLNAEAQSVDDKYREEWRELVRTEAQLIESRRRALEIEALAEGLQRLACNSENGGFVIDDEDRFAVRRHQYSPKPCLKGARIF